MINLHELITENGICLELSATKKADTLKEMINLLKNQGHVIDKGKLFKELLAKDALETTGLGKGIAIPHVWSDTVDKLMVALGRSKSGVDFEALDNNPVHLVLLIVSPQKDSSKAMQLLGKACRILKNETFRNALLRVESKQKLIKLFDMFA